MTYIGQKSPILCHLYWIKVTYIVSPILDKSHLYCVTYIGQKSPILCHLYWTDRQVQEGQYERECPKRNEDN